MQKNWNKNEEKSGGMTEETSVSIDLETLRSFETLGVRSQRVEDRVRCHLWGSAVVENGDVKNVDEGMSVLHAAEGMT